MLSSHLLSGLIARDSATQVASRRALLKGLGLGVGASLMSSPMPQAATVANKPGGLDWSDPKDNLWAFGKIWFGYEGTGCLQCKWDPAGFLNIKSRETGYFTDLRTG